MELLEREPHLAELTAWLASVEERGGCIALVRGEAGIGKTFLLTEFSRQQQGTRVLWGSCDALFTPRPLAPLHDVARQVQGPLLAATNSGASRDRIFAAVLDELERTRTLVVFEDLHWADEATLDLLKYLGRRIQRTRALLVITYRDDEVDSRHPLSLVIGDLPRASTRRMSLSALSKPAVAVLARKAGRSAEGLHVVTGGSPFFVTEILATAAGQVPPTVRDAVLARVGRLAAAAREVAELVSVVPARTERWLLDGAASPREDHVEDCLRIGMVRDEDGAIAFRHEIARRALEDSLSPVRRQGLHAKVLSILATQPKIPAARLAHHADGARSAADVLRFAPLAAGQAASVGAHREAASHYRAALRHASGLPAGKRVELQELLSYEYHLTGQHDLAIEIQNAVLEHWRDSAQRLKEGDALRRLSWLNSFAGHTAQATRCGIEAVEILESQPAGVELALAYAMRADLDLETHAADSSIDWSLRSIALADPSANADILSQALNSLGTVRIIGGDAQGWSDLQRSLQLALTTGLPERVAGAYTNLGAMAVSVRQYEQASAYLSAGLSYCEERDMDTWRLYMLAYRARLRFEQGNWNGASEDAESVLRHSLTTSISRIPALRIRGHLRIRRGDPDANSPLEEAQALAGPDINLQRRGTLAVIRAEAAWLQGDRAGVRAEVQPAYELVCQRRDPRMKGELAAWLWRVRALEHRPEDIPQAYALEICGDWRGAALAWQALGCPYEHASMLAWYGGEAQQRDALAILEHLGATPSIQALRREMRARGARGVPRGSRISTRNNSHGLTKREAEILSLLSEGLQNSVIAKRLFVSTKTVDHHVSAILRKLRVPSRAKAIALMHRQRHETG